MVDTAEKGSVECTSEFDVAYVQQGAGAVQHWILLLQPFAVGTAARHFPLRCESEQSHGTSTSERRYRVWCVVRN